MVVYAWWFENYNSTAIILPLSEINSLNKPAVEPSNLTATAPLTGLPATPEDAARRAWAVAVENFPSVRPQFGLASADIVFESPTEGGITRFLAIFQSRLPWGKLGPVRSARPYFNNWARIFNAFYSHSGGTAEALDDLRVNSSHLQDVNEFFNEQAYQRDESKKAPHNLFTTAERFWNYVKQKNWPTTSQVPNLNFSSALPTSSQATIITLPYYPSEYEVNYNYRGNEGVYERSEAGEVQQDASTNQPIWVTNVIVWLTDITPILNDPLLKVDVRTAGKGKLLLFAGGQRYEGQWRLNPTDNTFKLTTPQGTSLKLKPGNIWISVMDSNLEKDIKVE